MGIRLTDRALLALLGHFGGGRNPERIEKFGSHTVPVTGQALHRNDDAELSQIVGNSAPPKTISRLRWIAGLMALTLALLLSACIVGEGSESLPSDEMSATASATPAPAAQATPTAAPTLTGGEARPDARIADIRFGQHPDFERLVIDFATDPESASAVPHWRIEKAAGEGVLRIHLPTATETAFTDAQLAGEYMWFTQVFVVRAPDRSLFVDVFIPAAYQFRVQELRDPLRLVIDVVPGGTETYILPATAKDTVLIAPRPGATVQGTLTVSGYSRHFEANNVIILQDSEGNELARAIATSTDYIETWGHFSSQLTVPARTGTGTLLVGDFDAQDGSFKGVTIPVQFGGS